MPLLLSFRKGAGLLLLFNQARHSVWTTIQKEESSSVRPEGAFLNLQGSKMLEKSQPPSLQHWDSGAERFYAFWSTS